MRGAGRWRGRFVMVRFAALSGAMLVSGLLAAPASGTAQELSSDRHREAADASAHQPDLLTHPDATGAARRERRPGALIPLYASFVALQALDVHSTKYALSHGAVEGNPLMRGVASNDLGLAAIKAAGTAGVILASERMWRKNKAASVIFMIAANSAMAWVVQHNYAAAR
jgi:hypothetical protein